MTPEAAAAALIAALPTGIVPAQLEEYGIESTTERAQAISRELLYLNLFWIFAAIEAHIPRKYQSVVMELILKAVEAGWSTRYPAGSVTQATFLVEWKDRIKRYNRLVQGGASPLEVSTEAGMNLEEQRVVNEEDRRNLLALLIDSVPIETYGQLLQDVG